MGTEFVYRSISGTRAHFTDAIDKNSRHLKVDAEIVEEEMRLTTQMFKGETRFKVSTRLDML